MKKISVFIILLGLVTNVLAQSRFEEEGEETTPKQNTEKVESDTPAKPRPAPRQSNIMDRLRFGGNLGLQFGTFTFINLSPRVYYVATEKLWLGAGVTFIYSKDNRDNLPPNYNPEQVVYGLNLSATYRLIGPLFVQAEYEPLNFERLTYVPGDINYTEERVWVHGVLLGGGISQPMGRGYFFLSALYNVTWSNDFDSYYSRPWVIRVGFGI